MLDLILSSRPVCPFTLGLRLDEEGIGSNLFANVTSRQH